MKTKPVVQSNDQMILPDCDCLHTKKNFETTSQLYNLMIERFYPTVITYIQNKCETTILKLQVSYSVKVTESILPDHSFLHETKNKLRINNHSINRPVVQSRWLNQFYLAHMIQFCLWTDFHLVQFKR